MWVLSVKWKLTAAIALIAVLLVALSSALFENVFGIIARQTSNSTAQLVKQAANQMDSIISGIDNQFVPLIFDVDVKKVFEGEESSKAAVYDKIDAVVQKFTAQGLEQIDILMVGRSTEILVSSRRDMVGKYRMLGARWINKIYSTAGDKVMISGYTVERGSDRTVNKVVSIARSVSDSSGEVLGYIMVEIPIEYLNDICDRIKIGSDGFVVVLDEDNYVIYNTDVKEIGSQFKLLPTEAERENDYYFRNIDNREMQITHYSSLYTGFTVMGFIPYNYIQQEIHVLRRNFMTVLTIAMVVIILYAYSVSYGITKPIVKLTENMKSLQAGDFSVRMHTRRKDEIGQLGNGFDVMAEQLGTMIDRVYKSQIREREERYNRLVATINPHFIYNTLESISMYAYMDHSYKTMEMLQRLADIMRAAANTQVGFVTVARELENVKSYLYLQAIRWPDLFEVYWSVDDSLLEWRTLHFLLQPIVENAIKHGFRNMESGGIIEVGVFSIGDTLVYTVRDNGVGIPHERMLLVEKELSGGNENLEVFALKNIHERLRLALGQEAGLSIQNNADAGVTVELVLPLLKEEQHD